MTAAREAAISYAAYRLLLWRASYDANLGRTFALLNEDDAVAVLLGRLHEHGGRLAGGARKPDRGGGDRVRKSRRLARESALRRPELPPAERADGRDPTRRADARSDALAAARARQVAAQGLAPIPALVQTFVGSQWGHVRGFALKTSANGLPIDPGAPPIGDPASRSYKRAAVDVIRATAAGSGAAIVASSPVDWNARANAATNSSLARDVKLYFALNGALHDTAIAAWGAKRTYQAPRPISMIRYMAFQGQSSDRKAPSYNAEGLPLVPGLIELRNGQVVVRTRTGWVLGTRWTPLRRRRRRRAGCRTEARSRPRRTSCSAARSRARPRRPKRPVSTPASTSRPTTVPDRSSASSQAGTRWRSRGATSPARLFASGRSEPAAGPRSCRA